MREQIFGGVMDNILSRWNAQIFVPQAIVSLAVYGLAVGADKGSANALGFALVAATWVAMFFMFAHMWHTEVDGAIVATSSMCAPLAGLSFMASAAIATWFMAFLGVFLTLLVALSAWKKRSEEKLPMLILSALPVIGAIVFWAGRRAVRYKKVR